MKLPVIFLSFANRPEDPFLDLSKEDDGIHDLFLEAQLNDDNNGFQLQRFSRITSNSLIKYLKAFNDQISIFHYAGHAGIGQLYLSDQGARSQGLASLLGQQTNLRCVFLNGCHTKTLVDDLLAKNVPVVIATDREVGDDVAIKLSLDFYRELSEGNSIKTSFENAIIGIQVTDDKEISFRNVGRRAQQPSPVEDTIPWGLYYKDPKALNWRLSQAMSDIQNTTDNFWIRLLVIFAAIFILFSWMNRHIGFNNTAFFLSTGPLAILGIGLFLLNAFKNVSPAISNMSKKASYLFLKTPMLIGIGLIVAAIVSFGSSIAITHEGTAQFDFVVTDTLDNKTWQWDITEEEANKSRKLIIASPFQSAKVLNAAGYQPYHFNLTPIAGNRFSTDVFEAKAGLLLRLHPMQFNSAARIKLTVTLPNGTIKTIDSINNFSVLIGSKSQFTANQKENWKSELIRMEAIPEFLHDVAIEKWQDPNMEIGNYEFKPGDKVKLTKISGRDTSIQEIIIENKKLNDVLLQ